MILVFCLDVFVELPGHQFLAPDIAWWSPARRPRIEAGAISVVPELVVEVLSPATRINHLGVKRDHYLAVDVVELWLVDPAAKTLTRARPAADDEELGSGDTLTAHLLNGFSLALSRVFGLA